MKTGMITKIGLTADELDLIINCLLIASSEYNNEFERVKNKFDSENNEHTLYWFNKSKLIYDLAHDIKHGKLNA